ncbi:hypothetical protein FDECE_12148 [Fusarium decemcellulare]|nr:hypothetical protein FDECE_12148 [Fusarium decemcellulare]
MEEATHVITGVWWGGRTAVTAISPSSALSHGANAKETKSSSLGSVIESIGQLVGGQLTTPDNMLNDASQHLTFQVTADIDPDKKAASISDFDGASDFIDKLPASLKKVKAGKGSPVAYDLVPVKDFASMVSQQLDDKPTTTKLVDEDYRKRAFTLFERLYAVKQDLDNYLKILSQHELSVPQHQVSNTQQKITDLAEFEDF